MHVSRIGFTPLKGTAHAASDRVVLTEHGPAGDRVFCLVDRDRARVLRTVENPGLVTLDASWDGESLRVQEASAAPRSTGERLVCDYWGREATLDVVAAEPVTRVLAGRLGREVALCRVSRPGVVVYGASVTLVTTGSMAELARRTSPEVGEQSARFRSTFLLDTGDLPPHAEDEWVGRRLTLGDAEVTVRARVPRCAVVDLDPSTGRKDPGVLKELGRYRLDQGEIWFGIDATVTRPGTVELGDPVRES